MRIRRRVWVAVTLVLWAGSAAAQQAARPAARIEFAVDASDPASGTVPVTMRIAGVPPDPLRLAIPAWRPGSYRFQNYASAYQSLEARRPDGAPLPTDRLDPRTFQIRTGGADTIEVRYVLKPDAANFSADHFHIDAVGTYPYVPDRMNVPIRVRFSMPSGWRVATGLAPAGDGYEARDYDTFADCPTELGRFELRAFEQDGARYEIMVHGSVRLDWDAFLQMHRRIVAEGCRLFGGAPFERYLFLYHLNNRFGGYGLEHLNSADMQFHGPTLQSNVLSVAPLTAHEFFHLWNVKRIRPRVLGPFDYAREARTRALWWAEGVTDYYAHLILVRAGLTTEAQFLAQMAAQVALHQAEPDRLRVSVEEASWRVWDNYRGVDYYNKGLLLGLLIDLRMRRLTDNRKTLDDVMRFLDRWYVRERPGPIGVGFEEEDLARAVGAVCGHDFSDFFRRYVAGAEELPWESELQAAGLTLRLTLDRLPYHGVLLRGGTVRRAAGPAAAAGLREGDRITAVDGQALDAEGLRAALRQAPAGRRLALSIERDGAAQTVELEVSIREQVAACRIEPMPQATPAMRALRAAWLGGTAP
jgi:predicted metalloprotease with PDZ domain